MNEGGHGQGDPVAITFSGYGGWRVYQLVPDVLLIRIPCGLRRYVFIVVVIVISIFIIIVLAFRCVGFLLLPRFSSFGKVMSDQCWRSCCEHCRMAREIIIVMLAIRQCVVLF